MPEVTSNGTRIWYDGRGSGPPLVMVYGIGGCSADWWDPFLDRMAERYRLVLMDNRGCGNSEKPEAAWSMADMTADVMAVVEAAGLDTFHLLGCSLGSVVARHVVANHGGDRLRSLSLLCPPNGIPATEEDMRAALFWDRSKPPLDNARAGWPIVHREDWITPNEALLIEKFEERQRDPTPPRTFRYQLDAAGAAGNPIPAINTGDYPVLVLHGTSDRLVPPKNAETLAASIPRAGLVWLEGDSHSFWQHNPEGTADVLLPFLDTAEQAVAKR